MPPTTHHNTAPHSSFVHPSPVNAGVEPTLVRGASSRCPTNSYGRPRRIPSHSHSTAPTYKRDNLIVVRVFRVYEARNIE